MTHTERPRRTRIFVVFGVVLMVAAGTVLLLQVRVHESGIGASCGAPIDVISGRADWQQWFSADLNDPRVTATDPLVRTETCPTAINRRTMIAGILAATGLALLAVAAFLTPRVRHRHPEPRSLQTLGAWVTGVGATLTTAGVAALVVLLANPRAALYLYVDRWVVAIIGILVLIPAIALTAGGRALMLAANSRVADRADDDAS